MRSGLKIAVGALGGLLTVLILLGCCCCFGFGRPMPIDRVPAVSELVGTWRYYTMTGDAAYVTLRSDQTFEQLLVGYEPIEGEWTAKRGEIVLDGFQLTMDPFAPDRKGHTTTLYVQVTGWYVKGVAPFGGECGDPDSFEMWQRVDRPPTQDFRSDSRR